MFKFSGQHGDAPWVIVFLGADYRQPILPEPLFSSSVVAKAKASGSADLAEQPCTNLLTKLRTALQVTWSKHFGDCVESFPTE